MCLQIVVILFSVVFHIFFSSHRKAKFSITCLFNGRVLTACQQCGHIAEFPPQFDINLQNLEFCPDNWLSKILVICLGICFTPDLQDGLYLLTKRKAFHERSHRWGVFRDTLMEQDGMYVSSTHWIIVVWKPTCWFLVSDRHSSLGLETEFWCVRY